MTPRPRETSDQEILAATARVMRRIGPAQLTLADIAREAGVVPATLIQRFRTKRNLLLATCRSGNDNLARQFAAARAKYQSPLKALIELYVECSSFASSPQDLANGLAYLQIDLTDSDFRAAALGQFRRLERETKTLLDEAVAAGELRPCNTRSLSRLMQTTYNGSLLAWAIYRKGVLASWVRADITFLLRPFLRSSKISEG
jgi:AcrR family transcriptional regulator